MREEGAKAPSNPLGLCASMLKAVQSGASVEDILAEARRLDRIANAGKGKA